MFVDEVSSSVSMGAKRGVSARGSRKRSLWKDLIPEGSIERVRVMLDFERWDLRRTKEWEIMWSYRNAWERCTKH